MTSPSPFAVAQAASNNLGRAFDRVKDENAIERILSDAMGTGDPEVLQNSIGKILSQVSPERQGAAVQYLQNSFANIKQKQELAKKEAEGRKAAEEGGYTYGAPSAVQAQQVKNKLPPKPAGGLTGQAVPPQFGQAINEIIQQNPQANADELGVAFDAAGIPPVYSNRYVENRRRQDETRAGNEREDTALSRKEQLQFHKESEKYDEELMKQGRIAKQQQATLKNINESINSGNIKPTSFANIFKGLGRIGDKISEALLNGDQATLLTSIPQLLEGWKDVFGVRLTDADLRVLQDKLPSIGKSPEANKAVTNILNKYAEMNLLRSQIGEQIKKAHKNLRPLGFASMVEQRFDEMTAPVRIIRPAANGRPEKEIEIPAYKLSEALESGARLANEL